MRPVMCNFQGPNIEEVFGFFSSELTGNFEQCGADPDIDLS